MLNSTTGRETYKVPWTQIMAMRKETFLLGGNVKVIKEKKQRKKKNAPIGHYDL